MTLTNTVILNIPGVEYHFIINRISKSRAINLLKTADLSIAGHYKIQKTFS